MEKTPKKSKSKESSKSKEKKVNSPKKKTESKSKDKENKEKKEYPSLPLNGKFKFIHWNINGLRPLLKTKELDKLIEEENPDFICFNEIKVDNELIEKMSYKTLFKEKYISYFYPSEKKGYSGTAVFTKYKPEKITYGLNIKKHDNEGRLITLEYDKFYLICCYTPNAGENLKRIDYRVEEWDKDFFNYVNNLKNNKDIILCGDLNVA